MLALCKKNQGDLMTASTRSFFYKQQGLSNESLDCENVKQRESRFETKMAKLSNKKIISKQENE